MLYRRLLRLSIIFGLALGTMMVFLVLPALAAEQVLATRSAVGNHYETVLVLDLSAGQTINISADCSDASGTGMAYLHYIEVSAVPRADHPEYNDYERWDCLGGLNASYTTRSSTPYQFIFHVHTNEYGCPDDNVCPTLTGISHFNYSLKVTSDTANPPAPTTPPPPTQVTAEPTVAATTPAPSVETTPDPSATIEPTAETTLDPSATPEPTAEATSEPPQVMPVQATAVPVLRPEMPRDSRLNFKTGDLTAVIYRNRDDQGEAALVIYGVNSASRGYFLCTVTLKDLSAYVGKAPDQNTLIKECSKNVRVYVLTTGEIQVNITEANKVFVTVFDSLAAGIIQRSLLEA